MKLYDQEQNGLLCKAFCKAHHNINMPNSKSTSLIYFQTLEAPSTTSEFIMKRFVGMLSILNHEPINVRRLITENIKYTVDASQRVCGNIYKINELCRLVGV